MSLRPSTRLASGTFTTLAPAQRLAPPHEVAVVAGDGKNAMAWTQHHQDVADRLALIGVGVTDGSDPAPGMVGETITATVPATSLLSLPNATNTDLIHIDLSPGDWDAQGTVFFQGTSKGGDCEYHCWVNEVSVTQPAYGSGGIAVSSSGSANLLNQLVTTPRRYNITATTRVYLGAYAAFSSGSMQVAGSVRARRMR